MLSFQKSVQNEGEVFLPFAPFLPAVLSFQLMAETRYDKRLRRRTSLTIADSHQTLKSLQEGYGSSMEQGRCHWAERFCLDVNMSWHARLFLWTIGKHIYYFFWFSRGISQEKKGLSKTLSKKGPEKSRMKQVSSVGQVTQTVWNEAQCISQPE